MVSKLRLTVTHHMAAATLVGCLLASLLLRAHMLGDPYYRMDESFYLLVGERLHQGSQLYSEIWDRKPPGLFAIYYVAAAFPNPVLAYQLLACTSAGLTAWVITRIIASFSGALTGAIIALWYLASLNLLDGGGGQCPVFYNLPMALAVLLIVRANSFEAKWPTPGLLLAMTLAGTAIVIKQSAAIEAVALGIFVLWRRSVADRSLAGLAKWTAALALAGALPALIILGWFGLSGRLQIFVWAMAGSNTARWGQFVDPEAAGRLAKSLSVLVAPLCLAAWSFMLGRKDVRFRAVVPLVGIWLVAAVGAALAVPTHFFHYLLPALVPCAAAMALAIDRRPPAALLAVGLALVGFVSEPFWSREGTNRHRTQIEALAMIVRTNDPQPKLLVFQGPISLYRQLGAAPLGPLVFPPHLYSASERDVSHVATGAELRRLFALRPTTVIRFTEPKPGANPEAIAMADGYVSEHCQRVGSVLVDEEGVRGREVAVWSRCR